MDETVAAAASVLKAHIPDVPGTGIILGSGLGRLVDEIEAPVRVRYENIPHFPVSSVEGHRGEVVCGRLAGSLAFVLSGRVHYYEGYSMDEVVFPVRVLAALGVRTLIVTNAAGGVNESFRPGDIVAVSDHINLMGDNPLRGSGLFQDLTEAYSQELRSLARESADTLGITLRSGVYAAMTGPMYETPAEIRALRALGADLVGMSTAPEVIAVNSLGLRVLALSVVTNMAAGISGKPLSHREVIESSREASERLIALLKGIVKALGTRGENG